MTRTYYKLFQNAVLGKFCFTLYSESSVNSEIKYELLKIVANAVCVLALFEKK